MKPRIYTTLSGLLLFLMSGCSGGKQLQRIHESESAYLKGNYTASLGYSEQIINEREQKGKMAKGQVYAIAGKSGWELEQYNKSLTYLEKAHQLGYSDEMMYVCLAGNYRRINNLSKEITALETCLKDYPDGLQAGAMRARLFMCCEESENHELADELWPMLEAKYKEEAGILEVYLKINQARDNEALSDTLAGLILEKEATNETALRWFAEKYYYKAENRYQEEMEAYEKKRTNSQYNKLLIAFKTVTGDFKTSLDYFRKLYQLYPDPQYATFLGNIYTRLDDEKTAKYYYNRSK